MGWLSLSIDPPLSLSLFLTLPYTQNPFRKTKAALFSILHTHKKKTFPLPPPKPNGGLLSTTPKALLGFSSPNQ
jgi:hypothetical protein